MSRTGGAYEGMAVTTRQWVSIHLAIVAMAVTSIWALVVSLQLLRGVSGSGVRTLSESQLFLTSWSYVHRDAYPPVIGYAYPPLTLWVGLVLLFAGTIDLPVSPVAAIRRATAGTRTRRQLLFSRPARADRDAGRNLKRQLRERGRAGLFSGGNVRLGIAVAGACIVLVTSLLAPANVTSAGLTAHDAQRGLLPMVCLVGSLIALAGLLLSFPYGRRERVVVDASGNLRSADDPAVPVSAPARAPSPGAGMDVTASDASPTPALVSGSFCPQCGSPVPEGGRFCTSCGTAIASSRKPAPVSFAPEPTAPVPEPSTARRPARRGRLATRVFWVFGILLLVVGGAGFALASVANEADDKTFATALSELGGDPTGSKAATADLRSRTDTALRAVEAYAASLEDVASAHGDVVDGLNRSWAEFTASESAAIARNELTPIIDQYRKAVTDQEARQSALAAAVARLQEVTP